jgi:hypothetical protein
MTAGSQMKWLMLKWASAMTNSATPVTRIRYQMNTSRRLPWGRRRAG